MSLLRSKSTPTTAERPSVSVTLTLTAKNKAPLDASEAWLAIQLAFEDNEHYEVKSARIAPNKEDS